MTTPASLRFCQVSWGSRGTCTLPHDHTSVLLRMVMQAKVTKLISAVTTLHNVWGFAGLAFALDLSFLNRRSFSFVSTWKVPTPLKDTS